MLAASEEMERPSKTGLRCNQGTVSLGPQQRIHAWRIGFLSGDRQRAGVHGLRHGAHCCRDLPRDRRHRCLFWPITSIPGLIGMAAIEHNRTTGDIGTSSCLRRVVQDRGLSQICRLERVPGPRYHRARGEAVVAIFIDRGARPCKVESANWLSTSPRAQKFTMIFLNRLFMSQIPARPFGMIKASPG